MCTPVRCPRNRDDGGSRRRMSWGGPSEGTGTTHGTLPPCCRVGVEARARGWSLTQRDFKTTGGRKLPTLAQAFRLEFNSPWNKLGEEEQTWSVKFHTTGTGMSSQAEAEAHAIAFAEYILGAVPDTTYLSRWIHYPVNSTVNDYLADYGSGAHQGTLAAYTSPPSSFQMLEVCHLWRCAAGKNSKGRLKYLFKYVHNAAPDQSVGFTNDTPAPYVPS